jgi:MSHA biogenesis protein MshP
MRKLQQGFSIITAIFLLVVLSFLGIAMVSFSTSQHQSSAMDVMGSRAYQAARAGIEWQAHYVVNSDLNASTPVVQCGVNNYLNLGTLGGTLSPFAVAVNCAAASHVEGTSTIWIYDVSAVACTDANCPNTTTPGANYVERVISVKMGR